MIFIYVYIFWINLREEGQLLKLKDDFGKRINVYKLDMNKFRPEIRRFLTIKAELLE